MSNDPASRLNDLFEAERAVRQAQADLADVAPAELLALLRATIAAADADEDRDDAAMRMARAAELLGEIDGAEAVDLLIDVLASEEPEARLAAGETLEERAFSRFKEVALGVERALARLSVGSPALSELPYLLAEVPEPGVLPLLGRFLAHADADAVACAIEALSEVGDPAARAMLRERLADKRTVELGDESGDDATVTIGELAREAISLLDQVAGPEPKRPRGRG